MAVISVAVALHLSTGCGGDKPLSPGHGVGNVGGHDGGDASLGDVSAAGDESHGSVTDGTSRPDGHGDVSVAGDERNDTALDVSGSPDVQGDPAVPCIGLTVYQCPKTPGCALATCPTCSNQPISQSCFRPGVDQPPTCIIPPCILQDFCQKKDETSCKMSSACQPLYCPSFQGCWPPATHCPSDGAAI